MLSKYFKSFNPAVFLLFLTATIVSTVWMCTQHLTFTADSSTYLQYATWLTGGDSISPIWYIRTPGLPLALILSGVTAFSSFVGFMALQAAASVAIVWLLYSIVKLTQPRFAILAAWIGMLTSVPFIFSTMVMTEHLNLCGYLGLVYCLLQFQQTHKYKFIYLAAIANIMLFLLKPSNYYVVIISLSFIAIIGRNILKSSLLRFSLVYGIFVLCYMVGFSLLKLSHPGQEGLSAVFQGVKAIAYLPYTEGVIQEKNGSASAKVIQAVRNFPATEQVFSEPSGYNYNLMAAALVNAYGKRPAEILLCKASFESFIAKPTLFLRWLGSLLGSSANNYTGQMLFYQVYLKSPQIVNNESEKPYSKINAENGPATSELLQHLWRYILHNENKWQFWEPASLFSSFRHNPEGLFNNMMLKPNHIYHWFMWQALDREIGPIRTSELFMAAAKEAYKQDPRLAMTLFDDLATYFLGPDVTYKSGARVTFLPIPGVGERAISPFLTEKMRAPIDQAIIKVKPQIWDKVYAVYSWLWLIAKPMLLIMTLLGIPVLFRSKMYSGYWLIFSFVVYNALIVCVFADPFFRYSALTWFLSLIVALQTGFALVDGRVKVFSENPRSLTATAT